MYFATDPLQIIDLPADSEHCGGTRRMPRYIYLHHTGGIDSRLWLSRTSKPAVSCHRLIWKDGTIFKLVDDSVQAYTQGKGILGARKATIDNLNIDGLSIELENLGDGRDPYPLPQLIACSLQVVEWHGKYGYLPILTHSAVDPRKNDPRGFPWSTFYECMTRAYRTALCDQKRVR